LLGSDAASAKAARGTLARVLGDMLAMLHPFTPYVTEVLWKALGKAAVLQAAPPEAHRFVLLTTDLPISQVGKLVGWHDPNYFARRFRQAFTMTAREYREQLPTPPLARDGDDWIQW